MVAADAIDFDLRDGERLAVVGQNGAGKTTFINICTGYLKPDAGTVCFDGHDITGHSSPRDITRRGVGRSFQLPQIFTEHTVRECLLIAASSVTAPPRLPGSALEDAVDAADVDETLRAARACVAAPTTWPARCPRASASCSTSRWRWCCGPKLLIMDEPTSGVSERREARADATC